MALFQVSELLYFANNSYNFPINDLKIPQGILWKIVWYWSWLEIPYNTLNVGLEILCSGMSYVCYACLALNDHDGQNSWDLRLVQAILYRIFSLITLPQPQLVTWPRHDPVMVVVLVMSFSVESKKNVFFGQDHISSKSRTHKNQSEKILCSEI